MSNVQFILPKVKKLAKKILGKDTNQRAVQSDKSSSHQNVIKIARELEKNNAYKMEVVATRKNSKVTGANWLVDFKGNEFSEHGEDGIIAKIFEILKPENKWVCEFGAHDPEVISNTWRLIHKENWNAVLIEADDHYFGKLKNYYADLPSVHCVKSMVSFEGQDRLDNILEKTPIPTNLDFMVIDIDGNDYHVWDAITKYQSKVLMIEFNASIPTNVVFTQARDLSVNQGSSLAAMVSLAKRKGYKLIAVTSWNAFFVKDEYFHLFFSEEPALEEMYVYPAKHPIWMRAFQLYDGTLTMAPWNEMLWHRIDLKSGDYQALPESYRKFSRELATKDFYLDASGKKVSKRVADDVLNEKVLSMPANKFGKFAKNIFSYYGEDGILEKLIEIIAVRELYFVDVGAGDGIKHSRTRNLAINHRWNGLFVENDDLSRNSLSKSYNGLSNVNVHPGACTVSEEGALDRILAGYKVPENFDLLSLSLYGNEYHVWESLSKYSPNVVAVQINPTIPNDVSFIQSKNDDLHQGCSLRALFDLAHYKGYELVATTLETAFFVKRNHFYRCFEVLGLNYVELDEMFCPAEMNFFQLYDGTIALGGLDRLLWHAMVIDKTKLQVVPEALRKFHQYADKEYKPHFYRV